MASTKLKTKFSKIEKKVNELEKQINDLKKLKIRLENDIVVKKHCEVIEKIYNWFGENVPIKILKIIKKIGQEEYYKEFYIRYCDEKWYILMCEPESITHKRWCKSEVFYEDEKINMNSFYSDKTLYNLLNSSIDKNDEQIYKMIIDEEWLCIDPRHLIIAPPVPPPNNTNVRRSCRIKNLNYKKLNLNYKKLTFG